MNMKKSLIATTPNQSARLLKCGVPAESADAYWDNHTLDEPFLSIGEVTDNRDTPAFSLSAMLGLLPKLVFDKAHESFYFSLAKECASSADYNAAYKPCWAEETDNLIEKRAPCPIEACVQLIEWLVVNGYKLNGIEKGGINV